MDRTPGLSYHPAFDGLRALAVCSVIAFHFTTSWDGGYIGVDMFFVLSGFLITTLLWHDTRSGRSLLAAFYRRRAARLLPALFLTCALVLVLFGVFLERSPGQIDTIQGVAAALTYTTAWIRAFTEFNFKWMGHVWSLSVEEWFYAVWPLVFLKVCRTEAVFARRRVSLLLAGALLYRGIALLTGFANGDWMYNGPDFRAEQLLIGCVLALWLIERPHRVHPAWAIVPVGFLIGFVVLAPNALFGFYPKGGSTLVAFATAVIIGVLYTNESSLAAKVLGLGPLVWIGKRSYGIYLFHAPIFGFLTLTPAFSDKTTQASSLAATLVLATVSYRFVEMPVRKRFRPEPEPADAPLPTNEPDRDSVAVLGHGA